MWFQSERWRCFFRGKMWAFIPLKWLNLPFIIYLFLYWCHQPKNIFGTTKVFLLWDKNFFFDRKLKMTTKFDFENFKIPQNGQISVFFEKNNLVTFYCCFFRFFPKNCQKVKGTNLTKNGQNYHILLETIGVKWTLKITFNEKWQLLGKSFQIATCFEISF